MDDEPKSLGKRNDTEGHKDLFLRRHRNHFLS